MTYNTSMADEKTTLEYRRLPKAERIPLADVIWLSVGVMLTLAMIALLAGIVAVNLMSR